MKILADNPFGVINPPPGFSEFGSNPGSATGSLIGAGLKIFLIIAGLLAFVYLLMGAFDWITSGGEKEKISGAQQRITNAIIGFVLIFVVLAMIATMEQFVFKGRFCFGLTCEIQLPNVNDNGSTSGGGGGNRLNR